MKRVVISGATGTIGMALINKCLANGAEVLVLCRKSSARSNLLPKHPLIRVEFCDLSGLKDYEIVAEKSYDVFYHFAWEAPNGEGRNNMYLQLKNVEYALDAVAIAQRLGCHTFVGAGSQAEYGRVEGKLSEMTSVNPETGYGIAKLCAGQMTAKECEKRGMRHVWMRILSVYGPYDGEKSMISLTGRALLAGKKPRLTRGEQIWDYIYCDDVAEAMWLVGENDNAKGVYVLGSGTAKPLREYIYQLRDGIDSKLELGFGEIPYSEMQVMYLCADISKLNRDTGFVSKVDFAEGICKTIEWLTKEG